MLNKLKQLQPRFFILFFSFFLGFLLSITSTNVALAQVDTSTGTILPKTENTDAGCNETLNFVSTLEEETYENYMKTNNSDVLGCAIKTGRVSLAMIPFFIRYLSNFVLGLVGLISLLFVVLGGFFYVTGGLTENKEKGKKFIQNALTGLVVAIMAWTIVNVIIGAVTG